jgi:hypothetical protein
MIRLLRRLIGAGYPDHNAHRKNGSPHPLPDLNDIPVPDVVEGNGGESDWNMFQDSVLELDSQLQALTAAPVLDKTQPLSSEDLNRYAKGPGRP